MKIILVATDARGKNLVFVTDALRVYDLEEAVQLTKDGKLDSVYPVRRGSGVYLRTKPAVPKKEHLDRISISSYQLFSASDNLNYALSTPAFANYWLLHQHSLKEGEGPFIVIGGYPRITKEAAKGKFQPHRDLIFAAAKKFDVDPYLLGAIVIDEITRFSPLEMITDPLGGYFVGVNTSAGVAQVKTKTARGLIKDGYYNPNHNDSKLSLRRVQNTSLSYLYRYVKEPKHSISFAAARMRALTDEWKKFVDLGKKPEIITTLYHLVYKRPHAHPQPNDRGLQIANEFYRLAQKWLDTQ